MFGSYVADASFGRSFRVSVGCTLVMCVLVWVREFIPQHQQFHCLFFVPGIDCKMPICKILTGRASSLLQVKASNMDGQPKEGDQRPTKDFKV